MVLGAFGVLALVGGFLVMTTWEIGWVRTTTFDRDFTGLVCGVPFDNPGWETGSPCHGAVNRQTALGVLLIGLGVSLTASGTWIGLQMRRPAV